MAYLPRHADLTSDTGQNAKVLFTHPAITENLVLYVNPNQIEWSYGLNTANFPTYGGEVVQILSMFFEDMTIAGDIRSYDDMEVIYRWFLHYIQVASQGFKGSGSYDTRPVSFLYPTRGWHFKIYPKALPSFHYGRDLTVPSYTIVAAVAETDANFRATVMSTAELNALSGEGIDTFGKATAAIGFIEDNPFSGPTSQVFKKPDELKKGNKQLADWFTNLIPAYLKSDFSDLLPGSKPPDLQGSKDGGKQSSASTGG